MEKIRECLLRLRKGCFLREIGRALSMHREIIRRVKALAVEKGWLDEQIVMPDDKTIDEAWQQICPKKEPMSCFEAHLEDIKRWHNDGYADTAIHRLLQERLPCSIGQVRRYLKKTFPHQVKPVMVRPTYPGEALDVDFCFLGAFWDGAANRMRKTWLFSARLRHSRRAYREVVTDQTIVTFVSCHIHAFEFFEGVPCKVVLDNLKAGVIKSCIDNDQLNRSYREMAEYYNVMLDPCLPNTPQHKGGVENDMRYIQSSFLPLVKEKQKQQPKFNLIQLQAELDQWNKEIADIRIVHGVGKTPRDIFIEEKAALRPLPESRWDVPRWFQCQVRRDWRIMYNSAFYSVPYTLIGKTVEVCVTTHTVRIFFEHREVALHTKATEKWGYQRSASHAPPLQEAVLTCNRYGLVMKAEEIGPHTHMLAEKILNDPIVDKLRAVRCLLKLALQYPRERLEKACQRALQYNTLRYGSVKNILEQHLDQEPVPEPAPAAPAVFKYARDPREYQTP